MERVKQNYHWIIALLIFIEMFLFGGLLNSVSVFLIPISDSLQVSRGNYSLAMVPYNVACTLSTMVSGYLFNRFGYKRSVIGGLAFSALSLVMTATCRSLAGFCFSKILLGIGYGVCFTAGAVRIVKDWFFKYYGLVFGVVSMSSGLGGSFLTIVLTKLIQHSGWRVTTILLAILLAITVLLFVAFMKSRPEEVGLTPYGFGTVGPTKKKAKESEWAGCSFAEWCRRPLFYLMVIASLVCCLAMFLTIKVVLPHLQDQGFSPEEAAKYQSVNMLGLAIAKLLCGAATDKLGPKSVSIFCIVCGAIGQLLLSSNTNPVLTYGGIILCGVGLCMTSIMIPLLVIPLFGYQAAAGINSVTLAMVSIANIFAEPIANLSYDRIGTYSPVFVVAAIMNICIIPLLLLVYLLAQKEKKRHIINARFANSQ